ncbi:hypothetical protein [Spirosoma agri]|uniref:Uncharacterized protein n=1 Tax=Spirosoma agri TaxID=1987381 RepID=A0A6M0IS30_9BACT|nr:hypothetical protein [Spirosoma agri]NEU70904.1 hypothetical protein [Spirosoma agri]
MALTKVLITVKTYPTISTKYDELVCTAGFLEDGSWIRIYPIQFRSLDYSQQYKKYDWIEIDLIKNTSDFRPESYRPVNIDVNATNVGHVDTKDNWRERKEITLKNVYTNLGKLIADAKDKEKYVSLAVFKPTRVKDFKIEAVGREWDRTKLEEMQQLNLFVERKSRKEYVRKLPYKFSYVFEDDEGRESTLMIEDWEIGALFWKYEDEAEACQKVKQKYYDDLAMTKDIHFFLGTTKAHHLRSKNPFIIIGTFHPTLPKIPDKPAQLGLFD